jgi:hypothetical protein
MAATFKLLPCPFCGGQARVRAEQKNRTYLSDAPNAAREAALWAVGRGMILSTSRRATLQSSGMNE